MTINVQLTTIVTAISGMSVSGVTVLDMNKVPENAIDYCPCLFPRPDDPVTDIVYTRVSTGGDSYAKMDLADRLHVRFLHREGVVHYVDLLEAQLRWIISISSTTSLGSRYRTPLPNIFGAEQKMQQKGQPRLVMTVKGTLKARYLETGSRSRAGSGRLSRSLFSGRGVLTTPLPFFLKVNPADLVQINTVRKSLNQLLRDALVKEAGGDMAEAVLHHALDALSGRWEEDPDFDRAVTEQDRVDEAMWR